MVSMKHWRQTLQTGLDASFRGHCDTGRMSWHRCIKLVSQGLKPVLEIKEFTCLYSCVRRIPALHRVAMPNASIGLETMST